MDDKIKVIIEDEEALDVTSQIKDDFLKGEKGDVGPANTLTIGNVTSGEDASASIRGKSPNQVLDLVLPRGKISESDYDTVTDMVVSKVEPTLNQNLKESKDYTDNAIIKDFKDISYDQDTCTFVFTRHDNTIFTVDLPIENTVKNGRYDDETKELVLILVSDQEIRIPATGLIDDYVGLDSATIQVVVSANNQITCNILGGSISKTLLTKELQEEINNKVDLELLNNYMKKDDYADEVVISPTEPTTNEKVWIDNEKNIIKAKNGYGEFTAIYDESKINKTNYSTEEQRIGNWINGKPLYRKVIYLTNSGFLYNGSTYDTGIKNIETIVELKGMYSTSDFKGIIPLNSYLAPNNFVRLGMNTVSSGIIDVSTGSDMTSSLKRNIIIIMEYTKTTDV